MPNILDLAELSRAVYEESETVSFRNDVESTRGGSVGDHGGSGPESGGRPWGISGKSGKVVTWYRQDKDSGANGFFGALYTNRAPKEPVTALTEYVIAFRGTEFVDGFSDDVLGDDLEIFRGQMPPQALNANSFADKHSTLKPILTGHSLGGGLAIIAAARHGLAAVTFNAPGMEDSCQITAKTLANGEYPIPSGLKQFSQMVARCEANPRIRNIRIGGDPVSNAYITGNQPGETTTYEESQCTNYALQGASAGARFGLAGALLGGLAMQGFCRHKMDTVIDVIRSKRESYEPIQL